MIFSQTTIHAMTIAEKYHHGQYDKAGVPYIVHVLAVASAVETENEICVALLHDLLEDTEADYSVLSAFNPVVQEAIHTLTRRDNETYMEYIARVKTNQVARRVKIADIEDHICKDRSEWITPEHRSRYEKALVELEKGGPPYLVVNDQIPDLNKELCAIISMRRAIEIYSQENNVQYNATLLNFSKSWTYDALLDFETELWKEGPMCIYSIYCDELERRKKLNKGET